MNILKWKGLDIDPMKIHESTTVKPEIGRIDTAFNESTNESGITVLYPKIEAIHEGRTRNFNRYLAEKLKGDPDLRSGVYSWTAPYPKPVIYNHDINTEATGRVYSASYSEYTSAGRPGIIVTPKITSEKAISDIQKGLLLTVSIGASTNAAVCSCCGTDIINEGWCGHMRGEEYDGQVCEWVAGDLFFDELSWVNVPADSDAMIISTGTSNNTMLTAEKVVVKSVSESTVKEEDIVTEKDNVQETTVEETNTEVEVQEDATQATEVTEKTVEVTETSVVEEEVEESAETQVEESLQSKVTGLEEALTTAQTKVTEAEASLAESQRSVEELTAANTALAKELHETAVGFLVDLRMAIGKESVREDAVTKFSARSLESLRDSISDILAEKPAIKTTRTVEKVEKPEGTKVVTESKTVTTESAKVMSNEEILMQLLGGSRR